MNRVFLFPTIFILLSLTGFVQDPTNAGQAHAEFFSFDFKTKPIKGDGKEASHGRPHN
jgi:hypothetical protein